MSIYCLSFNEKSGMNFCIHPIDKKHLKMHTSLNKKLVAK